MNHKHKEKITKALEEERGFSEEKTLFAGSDKIQRIVPPIAMFSLRATTGCPSLSGHLFVADGWNFLLHDLIKENSTVLDIGCGCGRMARSLMINANVKKYIGLDNFSPSIEWCKKYLTPFNQSFSFHHIDIYSEISNPHGKIRGKNVSFPVESNSIDFIFAASLFTHLMEDDCNAYLSEVKRTLKRGGIFLSTIHTSPRTGHNFSGNEIRVDIDTEYFKQQTSQHNLNFIDDLGILFGQRALIFTV